MLFSFDDFVFVLFFALWWLCAPLDRPGGDLLSRGLSRSTIGAEGFHVRVRDGIGCRPLAIATRPVKRSGMVCVFFCLRDLLLVSVLDCFAGMCVVCWCIGLVIL